MRIRLKHIAKCLYFVAGFLFALHQITPHTHHEDLSSKEDINFHHEETDSFQDLLQLIFHTKVSHDDFSQLLKSEQKTLKHSLDSLLTLNLIIEQRPTVIHFLYRKKIEYSVYHLIPDKFYTFSNISFRGPPQIG